MARVNYTKVDEFKLFGIIPILKRCQYYAERSREMDKPDDFLHIRILDRVIEEDLDKKDNDEL